MGERIMLVTPGAVRRSKAISSGVGIKGGAEELVGAPGGSPYVSRGIQKKKQARGSPKSAFGFDER
jgi:hypothetical protein